ncbi:MAG: hypothetical protein GXO30_07995 [Epsilonproteobacteria bacterium]|nr:hypothetical protein [Campylobacterota bacterium]
MKSVILTVAVVVVGLFVFSGCAQKAPTPTCVVVEADPCCVPCAPACN